MKELSLNILDIAENSVKAGASLTQITLEETDTTLLLTIRDNGSGMSKEVLKGVTDPFYTTRTTRPVGMGLPLLKLAAEQAGGWMEISSVSEEEDKTGHGTEVRAFFHKDNIDIEVRCPICLGRTSKASKPDCCFDTFCNFCLKKWKELSSKCPILRRYFQET